MSGDEIGDGTGDGRLHCSPHSTVSCLWVCNSWNCVYVSRITSRKKMHTLCNLLEYCLSPKFKRCLWVWNVYAQHFHLGCVISFLKNWRHVEIIAFGLCGRPTWSFINTKRSILFRLNVPVEDNGARSCSQVYFYFYPLPTRICVPQGLWCNIKMCYRSTYTGLTQFTVADFLNAISHLISIYSES